MSHTYSFTLSAALLLLLQYGVRGSPHVRKVRFTLDEKRELRLDWGTGSILLDDVVEVVKGKTTQVFKRYASESAVPAKACFSVVTDKRTLDLSILVTKTQRIEEKRDLLVFGLGEVTGTRQRSTSAPNSTNGSSDDKDKRRPSFTPSNSAAGESSLSGGGSSSGGRRGATGAEMGMASASLARQKLWEAILNRDRVVGPMVGALTNSLLYSPPLRDEYSVSTRPSAMHTSASSGLSLPSTPSLHQSMRNGAASPQTVPAGATPLTYANYSKRGNTPTLTYGAAALLMQQQQQLAQLAAQQRQLADAYGGALPPPHFAAAAASSRSTNPGLSLNAPVRGSSTGSNPLSPMPQTGLNPHSSFSSGAEAAR